MLRGIQFLFLYILCGASCHLPLHSTYSLSREGSYDKLAICLELDTTTNQFNLHTRNSNPMVGNHNYFGSFYRDGNRLDLIPHFVEYSLNPLPNSHEYSFTVIDGIRKDTLDFFYVFNETFELDTIASKNFTLSAQSRGDVIFFPIRSINETPEFLRIELAEFGHYTIIEYSWYINRHLLMWNIKKEALLSSDKTITLEN